MISEKKYHEIVTYAHRRLGRYPHLDPFDIAHECIMHPDFGSDRKVWMRIFKTAMYRALDMTNLEVAIEATQVRHQSKIEETFECPECGALVPERQWRPAKSICRTCYAKAYYEANKEKFKAYKKAYNEANKEKRKAYSRAYYEANREKIKAYWKAYREAKKKEAETQKKQNNATQTNNPRNEIQNHPRKREN